MDQEALEFAQSLFELARSGGAEQLAAYVDAGVPADLTNASGDTLLLDAGADPLLGSPHALATAQFFELPEMVALLRAAPPPEPG